MTKSKNFNKKLFKVLLQTLFTVGALAVVLNKTDLPRLAATMRSANPWYLFGALLFFNISKIANAIRLNRFFSAIGLQLSSIYNLKLYYLGMFYNLFLPGGIGGDGYKIYILKKNHEVSVMSIFNAVLWDRITGIFALLFLSAALLIPSSFAALYPEQLPWAWFTAAVVYPLSLILTRLFYRQFMPVFLVTAIESIVVQAGQLACAWCILAAISITANQIDYLAIFLISSAATVLPVTIGGAGAREVTFYYALEHLGLDTNNGIALSLIFFAISAISSLIGILMRIRHEKSTDGSENPATA